MRIAFAHDEAEAVEPRTGDGQMPAEAAAGGSDEAASSVLKRHMNKYGESRGSFPSRQEVRQEITVIPTVTHRS